MASRTNGGSSNGPVDKGADFANYFCTYAFLYHQKEMLSDRVRMDAYYNAVFQNKHHFQGKLSDLVQLIQERDAIGGYCFLCGMPKFHSVFPFKFRYLFVEIRLEKAVKIEYFEADASYIVIFVAARAVLDVGTGSGILAIWSAQAGARKVYAVEATKMSEHARTLVQANNLQDIVEVIEGSMEEVVLPEKVDVIISEWMGYFLLRESMFDSVICARDRWLKPSGASFKCKKVATSSVVWVVDEPRPYASCKMVIDKITTEGCQLEHGYPSHARMWVGPIRSGLVDQKKNDYEAAMDDWYGFLEDTKDYYGVDMSVLTRPFSNEQEKYYLQTSLWNNLHPNQVIGTAAVIKEIDCLTASVDDILEVKSSFSSAISMASTRLCGFAGWFDVHFRGRGEDPAQKEIELTTAPSSNNGTHWGQQIFLLHPPVHVDEEINLDVSFSMNRSKENHRLMEVEFDVKISKPSGKMLPPINKKFYIE
ncbi:hypothetical protein Golax_006948 [Gossypium laxum]|uniref:Protein arginine N-methyltransferase domain-containing protein n=2 Tax=Gossypium TaxID=3633 RepID=A0A7J9A5D8_9ROSI|nr:hypothetical protein [Gossypium laxum]